MIPSAIASSRPAPVLRTLPGAKLTVMRLSGNSASDERSAARTALARLASGRVGETDDVVAGQARADVDLDPDGLTVDAEQGRAGDRGEHGDLRNR